MSNGQFPGPVYPQRTERSHYQYGFYNKHHKTGYSEDSQWLSEITHDEEFAVFDLADLHDLSNEKGDLYGLRLNPERAVMSLGTREEQVAEFPLAQGDHPWHGYPAWPIMRLDRDKSVRKYPAPREAFEKMKQAGLINENQRKRLAGGKQI
jgi:hypothetical protein